MQECGWVSTSAAQTFGVLRWANRSRSGDSITTSVRCANTNADRIVCFAPSGAQAPLGACSVHGNAPDLTHVWSDDRVGWL